MEAGTVPEKATISHRGEKYEIGRGKRFYGIWVVGAPYGAPVDRWPETRDGWEQAWTRFATVEVPGTIAAVPSQRSGLGAMLKPRRAAMSAATGGADGAPGSGPAGHAAPSGRRGGTALLVGEGLLVLGVVLGLAGLFPDYAGGQSLLSQGDQVVPHLCYVIAWAISAGPIALSVSRPRAARLGALFALGLSAVTLGLFVSDVGEVVSGGASLGSGLVISLLGWLGCTVGAAIALFASCRDTDPSQTGSARADCGWPARPSRSHLGPLALLVLAGIGTAAAFAPAWDSYTVTSTSAGTVQTITEGNAFSNPGLVITGNVAVMLAVVAVAVLAALWRPARQGALLLAGAIIPLAAQAVSALIQVSQSPYSLFGLTQARAAAEGVTISAGLTPVFWVYCVFVISLLISCAWLLTAPGHPATPASPWATPPGAGAGAGWPPAAPTDAAPTDATPTDIAPADIAPADNQSADNESAETDAAATHTVDTNTAVTKLWDTDPSDTESSDTPPADATTPYNPWNTNSAGPNS
jgi:hypothetical protein